jgi:Flp pilus assembly protein TadB
MSLQPSPSAPSPAPLFPGSDTLSRLVKPRRGEPPFAVRRRQVLLVSLVAGLACVGVLVAGHRAEWLPVALLVAGAGLPYAFVPAKRR